MLQPKNALFVQRCATKRLEKLIQFSLLLHFVAVMAPQPNVARHPIDPTMAPLRRQSRTFGPPLALVRSTNGERVVPCLFRSGDLRPHRGRKTCHLARRCRASRRRIAGL